jgi:hypothetical protein
MSTNTMSTDTTKQMQELFDRAVKGILQQGKPSRASANCLYRGPEGAKCAVGHLISDEQIKTFKIKEGDAADGFHPDLYATLMPGVYVPTAKSFLLSLQMVHDGSNRSNFLEVFNQRAIAFAKEWNLTPPLQEDQGSPIALGDDA